MHYAILFSVPSEPQDFKVKLRTLIRVFATWKPPAKIDGDLEKYIINVVDEEKPKTFIVKATDKLQLNEILIMKPWRNYTLSIVACNKEVYFGEGGGCGPPAFGSFRTRPSGNALTQH